MVIGSSTTIGASKGNQEALGDSEVTVTLTDDSLSFDHVGEAPTSLHFNSESKNAVVQAGDFSGTIPTLPDEFINKSPEPILIVVDGEEKGLLPPGSSSQIFTEFQGNTTKLVLSPPHNNDPTGIGAGLGFQHMAIDKPPSDSDG